MRGLRSVLIIMALVVAISTALVLIALQVPPEPGISVSELMEDPERYYDRTVSVRGILTRTPPDIAGRFTIAKKTSQGWIIDGRWLPIHACMLADLDNRSITVLVVGKESLSDYLGQKVLVTGVVKPVLERGRPSCYIQVSHITLIA